MLLGEVCEHFGWTLEYALEMPASQFFAMLDVARKLRSKNMTDLAWISRGSQLTSEGFMELIKLFDTSEKTVPDPVRIPKQTLSATSEEAKYAVMGAFASDTRHRKIVKVVH